MTNSTQEKKHSTIILQDAFLFYVIAQLLFVISFNPPC